MVVRVEVVYGLAQRGCVLQTRMTQPRLRYSRFVSPRKHLSVRLDISRDPKIRASILKELVASHPIRISYFVCLRKKDSYISRSQATDLVSWKAAPNNGFLATHHKGRLLLLAHLVIDF